MPVLGTIMNFEEIKKIKWTAKRAKNANYQDFQYISIDDIKETAAERQNVLKREVPNGPAIEPTFSGLRFESREFLLCKLLLLNLLLKETKTYFLAHGVDLDAAVN